MKTLGITGGIGAGKSTVLTYLQKRYGARVIQADEAGRLLQTPGHDCFDRIVETFGAGILDGKGNLRRDVLASLVFGDEKLLERLNHIVHPAVKEYIVAEIAAERRAGRVPFIAVEAALLLEDGYDRICDEIWYVYAGAGERTERLMRSRGYTREKAQRIMMNQLSEEEYRSRCKFVIDNGGDFVENTFVQIDKGLMEHGFLQHCQRKQRQLYFCGDGQDECDH